MSGRLKARFLTKEAFGDLVGVLKTSSWGTSGERGEGRGLVPPNEESDKRLPGWLDEENRVWLCFGKAISQSEHEHSSALAFDVLDLLARGDSRVIST